MSSSNTESEQKKESVVSAAGKLIQNKNATTPKPKASQLSSTMDKNLAPKETTPVVEDQEDAEDEDHDYVFSKRGKKMSEELRKELDVEEEDTDTPLLASDIRMTDNVPSEKFSSFVFAHILKTLKTRSLKEFITTTVDSALDGLSSTIATTKRNTDANTTEIVALKAQVEELTKSVQMQSDRGVLDKLVGNVEAVKTELEEVRREMRNDRLILEPAFEKALIVLRNIESDEETMTELTLARQTLLQRDARIIELETTLNSALTSASSTAGSTPLFVSVTPTAAARQGGKKKALFW